MVTNGPFRIVAWQKGSQLTLAPNPDFRPAPHLDQIVIRSIPEATTRIVEMQTGNVDMISGVTFDQVATPPAGTACVSRRSGADKAPGLLLCFPAPTTAGRSASRSTSPG